MKAKQAPQIQWEDEFNVGLADMDAQHRMFFDLILKTGTSDHTDSQTTQELLNELMRYATYHFACEEQLMRIYDFPGASDHTAAHDRLIMELKQFMEDFATNQLNISKLMFFLFKWFASHTTFDDQHYGRHIRSIRMSIS